MPTSSPTVDGIRAPEPINVALARHQAAADDWNYRNVAADLQVWAERMILEFKFEIGTPALLIEPLRRAYGRYRLGRNGFGIRNEIAIDAGHLAHDEYWEVLGTLLHELLHAWQERHGTYGKRNYHNRAFQRKAAEFGLVVDGKGHTQYEPAPTAFFDLLKKYQVKSPELSGVVAPTRQKGKSKLTLYQCPCGVKVRVGRSRFSARCLDCNGLFELQNDGPPEPISVAPVQVPALGVTAGPITFESQSAWR